MTAIEAALTLAILAVAMAIFYTFGVRTEQAELCEKQGGTLILAKFGPAICVRKDAIIR